MTRIPAFQEISKIIQLLFGSSVSIEVEPQQLFKAAEQLSAKASKVRYQLSDMADRVGSMNRYWEGQVYDSRRDNFKNQVERMEYLIELIESYSAKLRVIAENYMETEDTNEESADALPMNIIS